MFRVIVFAGLTAVLGHVSRKSLGVPGSHGFYRFFAWEAIAVLCLLNFVSVGQWFGDPWAAHQLVSWFLLAASLVPLVSGLRQLRKAGGHDQDRDEAGLLAFERTGRLVTTGAFRYIRHPMYTSLLLVCWGVFFKHPAPVAALAAVVATGFLVATAKAEETEDSGYFGDEYRSYMARTKMFLPFLF